MEEKHRQQTVSVFLVMFGMIAACEILLEYTKNQLDFMPILAGLCIGLIVYAVFFTRESLRRYFPEVLLAPAAVLSCCCTLLLLYSPAAGRCP